MYFYSIIDIKCFELIALIYKYGESIKRDTQREKRGLFHLFYSVNFLFTNTRYAYFKYHYWEITAGTNFSYWPDEKLRLQSIHMHRVTVLKSNQASNISGLLKIIVLTLHLPEKQRLITEFRQLFLPMLLNHWWAVYCVYLNCCY